MEVISPELVLVDPELARVERARLVERAIAAIIDAEALRLAVARTIGSEVDEGFYAETERASRSTLRYRRYALQGVLLLGLLATGMVLAVFVSGNWHQGTSQAAFVGPPTSPALPTSASALSHVRPQRKRTAVVKLPHSLPSAPTKAVLEQRILLLIIGAPRTKLPVDLVDPTTGLVKDNLQVVCRRARALGSFLCGIRLVGDTQPKLLVRYRAAESGGGRYTWMRGT